MIPDPLAVPERMAEVVKCLMGEEVEFGYLADGDVEIMKKALKRLRSIGEVKLEFDFQNMVVKLPKKARKKESAQKMLH